MPGAGSAVLLVEEQAEDPLVAIQLDDVPRELVGRVDLRSARCDALARERADELAELSLLVAQDVPGHARSVRASTEALCRRAAPKATPSGICPAEGGDQAAGIRSADSCLASKIQPASDSAGTNLLTSTILSAGTFARRAAATIASGDGAS